MKGWTCRPSNNERGKQEVMLERNPGLCFNKSVKPRKRSATPSPLSPTDTTCLLAAKTSQDLLNCAPEGTSYKFCYQLSALKFPVPSFLYVSLWVLLRLVPSEALVRAWFLSWGIKRVETWTIQFREFGKLVIRIQWGLPSGVIIEPWKILLQREETPWVPLTLGCPVCLRTLPARRLPVPTWATFTCDH